MIPDPDHIADEEELYRSIRPDYLTREGGVLRARSEAFGDRGQRVSVDRARLIGHDPGRTRKSRTDAVARLLAADVRVTIPQRDAKGQQIGVYLVDVTPDPLPDNPAHALIYANPDFVSPNHFRKLREHLARTHQIILSPEDD